MIVPGRDTQAGELQQAINEIYANVQVEWTGPLRRQVHMRRLYVYAPLLVTLYVGVVFAASLYFRATLPSRGAPIWRPEKLVILLCFLVAVAVVIVERSFAFRTLNHDYALVNRTVERLVHLRPPEQLANATVNPCETYFSGDDALVAMCRQDWASEARTALSRIVHTRLTSPELLRGAIRVGESCRSVGAPPPWWNAATGDQTERLLKLSCEVHRSGDSTVSIRDLSGLGDLPQWLLGGGREPALLRLENAFAVRTVGGDGDVYSQRIGALIGPEGYTNYQQQFLRLSSWVGGATIVVLSILAVVLYVARHHELHNGSRAAAVARRFVMLGSIGGGLVVAAFTLTRLIAS